MNGSLKKKIRITAGLTVLLTIGVFLLENVFSDWQPIVIRNGYGEGKRTESYDVVMEDGKEATFELEIQEWEYTSEEMQEVFQKVMKKLDTVILGQNKSLDRVETNLNLVSQVAGYPVEIQWELSSYEQMDMKGNIRKEDLPKEGTLLEIRGTLLYGEERAVYVRNAMLYPVTRTGADKLVHDIKKALVQAEESTREEVYFRLPEEVGGRKLVWSQKREQHWHYTLLIGTVFIVLFIYREREKEKTAERKIQEELLCAYPAMLSKITMLLSTGTTLKNAWEKVVQNYEKQHIETNRAYEEMKITLHEMQGGVPESEAYERFGRRCNITPYIKFGALLSQNLRKGSKGLCDLLRMEALQSFENRKSRARQKGEEAGTKLLMPMMGMLAVVLIMVMIPAFLTMQL